MPDTLQQAIIRSGKDLTPDLILYFKTTLHDYLEEFVIKRGNYAGHDYIIIGANQEEFNKLGFSAPYWTGLYDNWVVVGREREDMKLLTAQVTEGKETLREKAEAIAEWIYENVQYELNKEAPPWELVKGAHGDCSSFSPLVQVMLGCAGIDCWGWQGVFWGQNYYGHMTTMASLPEGWIMVDPTGVPIIDCDFRNISAYGYYEIDQTPDFPPIQPPDAEPWWLPTPKVAEILPYALAGLFATSIVLASLKK